MESYYCGIQNLFWRFLPHFKSHLTINATFVKGNHKGLPLHKIMIYRGNPLWLPLNGIDLTIQ